MSAPDCLYFEDAIEDWSCRDFCPACHRDCSACTAWKIRLEIIKSIEGSTCGSVVCMHETCLGKRVAVSLVRSLA